MSSSWLRTPYLNFTGGELFTGVVASLLAVAGYCVALALLMGDGTPWSFLLLLLIYALPIGLLGTLVIGVPAAVWIERRTARGSSSLRRYGPYVLVGAGLGLLLFPVYAIAAPVPLLCSLAGRAGAGWWRSLRSVVDV